MWYESVTGDKETPVLVEVHLYRARLFGLRGAWIPRAEEDPRYPWASAKDGDSSI